MIELYNFTGTKSKPEFSNFTTKVELFLKAAGLEYKTIRTEVYKAPKKKLPFIIDSGETVSDSEHIISYLSSKYSIDIEKELSSVEKAESYQLRKACDEYAYFILLYSRWVDKEGWDQCLVEFFNIIPFLVKKLVIPRVRKNVIKTVYGQGLGRHSSSDIYNFGEEYLHHLSAALGTKKYFLGENISLADMSIMPLLYNIGHSKIETEFTRRYRKFPNLSEYVERLLDKYFD